MFGVRYGTWDDEKGGHELEEDFLYGLSRVKGLRFSAALAVDDHRPEVRCCVYDSRESFPTGLSIRRVKVAHPMHARPLEQWLADYTNDALDNRRIVALLAPWRARDLEQALRAVVGDGVQEEGKQVPKPKL